MSAIYLIRHGQASFGNANYDELSPIGRTQAKLLGDSLRVSGLHFDAAYSGLMRRQQDTAIFALGGHNSAPVTQALQQHPCFNEFDHESLIRNHWKAVTDQDFALEQAPKNRHGSGKRFQHTFEKIMHRWVSGHYPILGEETWEAFSTRVNDGLRDIITPMQSSRNVAVFTSGGPIAVILKQLLQLSNETTLALNWQIANCSVTKLHYNGRRTSLAFFNNYTHLQSSRHENWVTYR
jgi:broad specificity phosphatase PhoE